MSEIRKETWKNPDYREKISKSVSIAKKKEIRNEKEFILDIGSSRKVHELIEKYNMSNSTINKKIKEILNHLGLKNYRDVKNYLKSHDIEDILKNLN